MDVCCDCFWLRFEKNGARWCWLTAELLDGKKKTCGYWEDYRLWTAPRDFFQEGRNGAPR